MQTWFITGISSGLGRSMAEHLLSRGHRVAGTVRDPGSVEDLRDRFGQALWVEALDVTDTASIGRVVDGAFSHFGHIDVLVNNAGYGLFGAVEGLTHDQIRHQIATNLIGPIEVTKAALPHLRKQGGGRVIAISSYGGQAVHAGASLYHASKWGLEGFFEALAQEVRGFGIGVTIVEPGAARTGFRAAAASHLGSVHDAYKDSPLARLGDVLSDPARTPGGDPARMAAAIVSSATADDAPLRLILGSDALSIMEQAVSGRLEAIRAQASTASTTDIAFDG